MKKIYGLSLIIIALFIVGFVAQRYLSTASSNVNAVEKKREILYYL